MENTPNEILVDLHCMRQQIAYPVALLFPCCCVGIYLQFCMSLDSSGYSWVKDTHATSDKATYSVQYLTVLM